MLMVGPQGPTVTPPTGMVAVAVTIEEVVVLEGESGLSQAITPKRFSTTTATLEQDLVAEALEELAHFVITMTISAVDMATAQWEFVHVMQVTMATTASTAVSVDLMGHVIVMVPVCVILATLASIVRILVTTIPRVVLKDTVQPVGLVSVTPVTMEATVRLYVAAMAPVMQMSVHVTPATLENTASLSVTDTETVTELHVSVIQGGTEPNVPSNHVAVLTTYPALDTVPVTLPVRPASVIQDGKDLNVRTLTALVTSTVMVEVCVTLRMNRHDVQTVTSGGWDQPVMTPVSTVLPTLITLTVPVTAPVIMASAVTSSVLNMEHVTAILIASAIRSEVGGAPCVKYQAVQDILSPMRSAVTMVHVTASTISVNVMRPGKVPPVI